MIQDIPPEVIDQNYTPPMEEAPVEETSQEQMSESMEETPPEAPQQPTNISPETIKELASNFVESIIGALEGEYQAKLEEKDKELEDGRVGLDEELAKRDEEKKATEETHKSKTKEMEVKHKENLKGKDAEIADLKKQLKLKDKEIKSLLKQVKDALDAED